MVTTEQSDRAHASGSLRRGAVGVPGVVILVIAATAPLTALASNFSLSFGFGNGSGTVGMVVVAAAIFWVFSAGYIRISQSVTNAAAYYAYIGFGLGRPAGAGAAMVATIAYNVAGCAMVAATGFFTDLAMSRYAGVELGWFAWAFVAWLINIALGIRGVGVAARVTGLVCAAQFAVLLALVVAVLARNPGGFEVGAAFSPGQVFSGNIGMALIFGLLSFAGYEASAAYCEEAREGSRVVKVATYTALGVLAFTFVLATWAMVAAVDDIQASAAADTGGILFTVTTEYLGDWAGPVLGFLIASSFLGAMVAFANLATRYLFALGRARVLPVALGTVGKRGTPVRAVAAHAVITAAILVPFALSGADPLLRLFPAISGITSLSVVVLLTMCSASVVAAKRRGALSGTTWETYVAPTLAAAALVAAGVLIVENYAAITGSTSWYVNLAPTVLLWGIAFGTWRQHRAGSSVLDQSLE